jgi:hypothetical protein
MLDGGDYIDGRSDTEAGFYEVHDFTLLSTLPVSQLDYSGGAFLGQHRDLVTRGQSDGVGLSEDLFDRHDASVR